MILKMPNLVSSSCRSIETVYRIAICIFFVLAQVSLPASASENEDSDATEKGLSSEKFYSMETYDGPTHPINAQLQPPLLDQNQEQERRQLEIQKEQAEKNKVRHNREMEIESEIRKNSEGGQHIGKPIVTAVHSPQKALKEIGHEQHERGSTLSLASSEQHSHRSVDSSKTGAHGGSISVFIDELYHFGIFVGSVAGWIASFYILYYPCQLQLVRISVVYLSLLIVFYCFKPKLLSHMKNELLHFPSKFIAI